MRIGVSGKGGVGKTTICALLSRMLARRGHRVIAIDCDSDPNLGVGIGIGIGEDGAARLRPVLDQSGPVRHLPEGVSPDRLLREYGYDGPDGVTVVLAAQAEKAGSG